MQIDQPKKAFAKNYCAELVNKSYLNGRATQVNYYVEERLLSPNETEIYGTCRTLITVHLDYSSYPCYGEPVFQRRNSFQVFLSENITKRKFADCFCLVTPDCHGNMAA